MRYPGRVVKVGETDASVVRAVRARLNLLLGQSPRTAQRLDERLPIFDTPLSQAVKLFQARHVDSEGTPLKQDGRLGPITWAVLFGDQAITVHEEAKNMYMARVVAIALAEAEREVREVPANSNRGPRVEEYQARSRSRPGLAWCCSFVYWCMDEGAKQLGRKNPMICTAGCMDHWQRAGNIGARRIKRAIALQDPASLAPGMIFIMDHGGGLGHTGIVAGITGGFLSTIEGNTNASRTREGGGVYRLTRKIGDINLGYVDYSTL